MQSKVDIFYYPLSKLKTEHPSLVTRMKMHTQVRGLVVQPPGCEPEILLQGTFPEEIIQNTKAYKKLHS